MKYAPGLYHYHFYKRLNFLAKVSNDFSNYERSVKASQLYFEMLYRF